MSTIRLGGVKVFENRAYLCSSCRSGDALDSICSVLAGDRINLGLLTHIADAVPGESITAACAKSDGSFSGYIFGKAGQGECKTAEIEKDVSRISIFPHDQRPEVAASLLAVLDANAIKPYGFASSPSAITVVVSSPDFNIAMERLFDAFAFSAWGSYSQWQAACRMDEQQHSEVRCSYNEQIIAVYGITRQTGLDLYNVSLPTEYIGRFGSFLSILGELDLKLPFLVSNSAPGEKSIHFSFALRSDQRQRAGQAFDNHLPGREYSCRGPVSALFVHGPHFGDRYGIANAFVKALRNAGIPILALSCAVSSISAVIGGDDPGKAVDALYSRFQTPVGQ
ncbi:MAG: ACT domain-containing protein [Syntrophobacteraceae bacterium]